ncbi:MAG: AAA family ATPase [Actinomycetota bacterium]|nr:AAA family ATPase [Actinomycetota bacterium]
MLLRLAVSNFRSIYETIEFSLIAVDDDRPAARAVPMMNHKVLTAAAIYGPNASGKSNVIDALYWLSNQVLNSMTSISERIPVSKFKFAEGPHRNTSIEVEMILEGVRYDYFVEFNEKEIVRESLHNYPLKKRRTVFERFENVIEPSRNLKQRNALQELTTSTTFLLSVGLKLKAPEIQEFARSIAQIRYLGRFASSGTRMRPNVPPYLRDRTGTIFLEQQERMQLGLFGDRATESARDRDSAIQLLRFADLGINDVKIEEISASQDSEDQLNRVTKRRQIQMLHTSNGEEVAFDLTEESLGTQKWFEYIGPMLGALKRGAPLVVDELDSGLHPNISERLVDFFRDPISNPRNAQLIFTTHDVHLMNALNRDEVWITERDETGATTLTALAEYGRTAARKDENLERAYIKGKYGGIPFLGDSPQLNALSASNDR